jgi:hypothetical protein
MPPSITFWNRLEPRPRADSIAESLAARVRDPLWLLARQWQVGEFAAADCGSPIYADLQGQSGPISGWMAASAATGTPLSGAEPLESEIESEPFTPDLATRVELGQWFETLIGNNAGTRMIEDLRATYPLPLVSDAALDRVFSYNGTLAELDNATIPESLDAAFRAASIVLSAPDVWTVTAGSQWVITDRDFGITYAIVATGAQSAGVHLCRDVEALRFLRVCAGNACDGVAIAGVARGGAAILQPRPEWTAQQVQALADAGTALAAAVSSVFGAIGTGDPASWSPPHAAFELSVGATVGASLDVLRATPGPHGEFDWTSFDLMAPNGQMPGIAAQATTSLSRAVVPGHVRFRGMPNGRWWEFETTETDFGGIQPEKRDLAKLIFMDFMLIHGDDWYLVPVDVPVGSIAQITGLFVHDTFGVVTRMDRADAVAGTSTATPGQQWTMFSPTWIDHAPKVGSYLVVPATVWPTALSSATVEEVRLVRDPVADMVWGIENIVESAVGHPWPGRERDHGGKPARSPKPITGPGAATMEYRLHTSVPVNWIPFVAVAQGGVSGGYALERAVLPGDDIGSVRPAGRLLQLQRLREQEVSTQGTVLSRVVCRSRWIDGSTRLWISRRRGYGTGTASSGLRFDVATADVGS